MFVIIIKAFHTPRNILIYTGGRKKVQSFFPSPNLIKPQMLLNYFLDCIFMHIQYISRSNKCVHRHVHLGRDVPPQRSKYLHLGPHAEMRISHFSRTTVLGF